MQYNAKHEFNGFSQSYWNLSLNKSMIQVVLKDKPHFLKFDLEKYLHLKVTKDVSQLNSRVC